MKNLKTAVIAGAVAVAAIIIAIVIVVVSGKSRGLYISSVTGTVSISNSESGSSVEANAGTKLSQGDIVTVSENGSCTLVYRTSKNKDDTNYMTLLQKSQIFVTDKFSGKENSEIYLNRGSIISVNSESLGATALVRTSNSQITTDCAVSIISINLDEEDNYTEIVSAGGNVYIQLYDEQGDTVNKSEPLGPGRKARVVSGDSGPYFAYLNENADLSEFNSHILRELFTVSSYVKIEFTSEEIKEAYDAIPKEEKESEPDNLNEVTTPAISEAKTIQTANTLATDESGSVTSEETTVITSESESESEISSEESESETTVTTTPTQTETQSETETESETEETEIIETSVSGTDEFVEESIHNDGYCVVYVVIDDEITEQEVKYGEDAVQPADPIVDGKKFIGWDESFNNITEDTTISAIFEDTSESTETTVNSDESGNTHTVTVVIGSKTTTQTVNDGESANIPSTVTLEGYTFKGWDTDYSNVTSDITVTAILEPISCSVTFIVDGVRYYTTVSYGGTAAAPVAPNTNSEGAEFVGWDKSLSNITGDTTITAIFSSQTSAETENSKNKYTVTFIIDGVSYTQTVEEGSAAVAPNAPNVNSEGKTFLGWDKDYSNITGDTTITAVYG